MLHGTSCVMGESPHLPWMRGSRTAVIQQCAPRATPQKNQDTALLSRLSVSRPQLGSAHVYTVRRVQLVVPQRSECMSSRCSRILHDIVYNDEIKGRIHAIHIRSTADPDTLRRVHGRVTPRPHLQHHRLPPERPAVLLGAPPARIRRVDKGGHVGQDATAGAHAVRLGGCGHRRRRGSDACR